MGSNWQIKRLGEVCEMQKIKNSIGNLTYVGMENIESNTGHFIGSLTPKEVKSLTFYFNSSHILYGRLRPYLNKVFLPNFEGHCSTEIFPIKVNDSLYKKYLFYWLTCDEIVRRINATCTGARMPRANMRKFFEIQIPLPPLPTQHRIVKILGEVFGHIAKAKENAEKNLQNAKELFESYLQSFFANQGKGWEEKKLGEIASEMMTGPFGSMLHKSDYVEVGTPVVNPQNIVSGKIIPLQKTMITAKPTLRLKKYMLRKNDIVMARRGEMGRCALVTDNEVGWLCGTGSLVIRLKNIADEKFINTYLSSDKSKEALLKASIGTTMSNLNQGILSDLAISLPPLPQQKSIVAKLDFLSAQIRKLEAIYKQKLADLEELKKSVLQKAFSGGL